MLHLRRIVDLILSTRYEIRSGRDSAFIYLFFHGLGSYFFIRSEVNCGHFSLPAKQYHSSFPVIYRIGTFGIFVLLKFKNKFNRIINQLNFNSKDIKIGNLS